MRGELSRCPVCDRILEVTELSCPACDLHVRGHFQRGCRFCTLEPEQRRILEAFLSCGGVLRDMEKVLGISYPTVRARVDAMLKALGYTPREEARAIEELADQRKAILDQLQAGEITAQEASTRLKALAAD
ncbi:MAG: DUF2089 domain-containing protein [Armatimonadota bacterium]